MKSEVEESGELETQVEERSFWHRIWVLRVPYKVKKFVWRACREVIPTKANLNRRHIIENALCERCMMEEETTLHALWSCSKLSSVWTTSEWSACQNIRPTNFKELLSWILNNYCSLELFVMTTWGIWHQRNQARLHRPFYPTDLIAAQAKERLDEFMATMPPQPPALPRPRTKWKPPDVIGFKINFDVAVFR